MTETKKRRGRKPKPADQLATYLLSVRLSQEFDQYLRDLCADRVRRGEVLKRLLERGRADGTLERTVQELESERNSELATLPSDELLRRHRKAQRNLTELEQALSQASLPRSTELDA
ncbi:hypothetical protein [Paraburkholderia sp. SIMBA_054]|uniref:hypothetical protein n=1 Tax=Paraburkholderia sp. SIMBA_054 TaxID=3085795 RepID=UPI00397B9729